MHKCFLLIRYQYTYQRTAHKNENEQNMGVRPIEDIGKCLRQLCRQTIKFFISGLKNNSSDHIIKAAKDHIDKRNMQTSIFHDHRSIGEVDSLSCKYVCSLKRLLKPDYCYQESILRKWPRLVFLV